MANNTGSNYNGENSTYEVYSQSVYKWTDPPRFFKANDPYWYQLDNLPLKQIHENCKWLKDQVTTSLGASGVGRYEINELQPYATGGDRRVLVRPGRFTGRVNDAFNKGIATFQRITKTRYWFNSTHYRIDADHSDINVTLRDKVFAALIGFDISASSSFPSNGLFDSLQHHQVKKDYEGAQEDPPTYTTLWEPGAANNTYLTAVSGVNNILNTPKNKLAYWQGMSLRTYGGAPYTDLQQWATEYTRRWGGVARTSLVDVSNELGIDIPSFADSDFAVAQNVIPSVRIDLVFIYTHPVDSKSTTILEPVGGSPTTITAPRLGVVKGAGIVTVKNQGEYSNAEADIQATPSLTTSEEWLAIRNNHQLWYAANPDSGFNQGDQAFQMRSPISDQLQQATGMVGLNLFGSFPSPDDLMNLTPLLAEELGENEMSLLGQSVLPVAYVMVRKGASTIDPTDIIDIRPFFRTAELSYNERAGVAAAVPPLSLANPAVGKIQMRMAQNAFRQANNDALQALYDKLVSLSELADTTVFPNSRWTVFTNRRGSQLGSAAATAKTWNITSSIAYADRPYLKAVCMYCECDYTTDISPVSNLYVRSKYGYTSDTGGFRRMGHAQTSQANGDLRHGTGGGTNQFWLRCHYDQTTETVKILTYETGENSVDWDLYVDGYMMNIPFLDL